MRARVGVLGSQAAQAHHLEKKGYSKNIAQKFSKTSWNSYTLAISVYRRAK
jgi:hypothetical protein